MSFTVVPGAKLIWNNQALQILGTRRPEGQLVPLVQVLNPATMEIKEILETHILEHINIGTLVPADAPSLSTAESVPIRFKDNGEYLLSDIPLSFRTEATIKHTVEKVYWLRKLMRHLPEGIHDDSRTEAVLRDIEHQEGRMCPFVISTLYKAFLDVRKCDGDFRAVVPQFGLRGGRGKSRLLDAVDAVYEEVFSAIASNRSAKIYASRIHEQVVNKVSNLAHEATGPKLKFPSISTTRRRVSDRFDAYEIALRNRGKEFADREFRTSTGRVRATAALLCAGYDDLDTAVFLVDERTNLPWGRCYLTTGIDEATRALLGKSLSPRSRSTESAVQCIQDTILPKDHDLPEYERCVHKWVYYGTPGLITLDNASYNDSLETKASIAELGIDLCFSKPYTPTTKPDIEHANHIIRTEYLRHLPGWVGEKKDKSNTKAAAAAATLHFRDFLAGYNAWVVNDYSTKFQCCLGMSPQEAWLRALENREFEPGLPRNVRNLALLSTIVTKLTFRNSAGLLRMGLRYNSVELDRLRRAIGNRAEVTVRYLPNDLSHLFVHDKRIDAWLRVPCIEDSKLYLNITNYTQSLILKRLRQEKFLPSDDRSKMLQARFELERETMKLAVSKRMRDRKASVRHSSSIDAAANVPDEIERQINDSKTPGRNLLEEMIAELDAQPIEGFDSN